MIGTGQTIDIRKMAVLEPDLLRLLVHQLDKGFFAAGDKVDDAEVWLGSDPKVPLTVANDLVVTLPRKSRKDMKVTVDYDRPIPAPVEKGRMGGKLVVTAPDVPPTEVPLVAGADVDRMDPLSRVATLAGYLVWGGRR